MDGRRVYSVFWLVLAPVHRRVKKDDARLSGGLLGAKEACDAGAQIADIRSAPMDGCFVERQNDEAKGGGVDAVIGRPHILELGGKPILGVRADSSEEVDGGTPQPGPREEQRMHDVQLRARVGV